MRPMVRLIPSVALPVLLLLLLLTPQTGITADASYDCIHTGHTNIGWSQREQRYTTESSTNVTKPSIVKLSDINTDRPFLTGQAVTRLHRLANDGTTTWFAEQALAGTIIIWTFFQKQRDFGPPSAVLVSTKTYDLMGPVSFTDFYACRPNTPNSGK